MSTGSTPLFVRLAAEETRLLDQAVTATGKSKRRLVEDAVREHLSDGQLVVGHAALREAAPEVLTLPEAAALLRVGEPELEAALARGEVPARRIGEQWRLSRAALLQWLGGEEPRSSWDA
jgi:excisionase family DNA binding protein